MSSAGSFFDFHSKVTRKRRDPAPAAPVAAPAPGGAEPLTVSQLTAWISRALKDNLPPQVYVKGEVSNYSVHGPSRNHYFTLKDATACIDCVLWRDEATHLKFKPADGLEVLAAGRVGVYPQRGRYQLYVNELHPLGQGALELAFRQLKDKLEREGLFAAERKRPLPLYPRRIVLVTSRQTAAVADMLKVLRRFPWLALALYHVPVQGADAGRQIAVAIAHVNRHHRAIGGADVILLGRGGGSLEDLWCFNDEAVARAVAASAIPVVTGIGHEVDTSIADLVADHHAHTPTEAAQVVTQHWRLAPDVVSTSATRLRRGVRQVLQDSRRQLANVERHETFRRPLFRVYLYRQLMDDREKGLALVMGDRLRATRRALDAMAHRIDDHHPSLLIARVREQLRAWEQRLGGAMAARVRRERHALDERTTVLAERHPRHRVHLAAQRLADLDARLRRVASDDVQRRTERLNALAEHLRAVGPEQVLRRGYTITMWKKGGAIVRSVAEIKPGDRMVTRFADGEVEWTAEDGRQMRLFP